jgi:hypothetical protein
MSDFTQNKEVYLILSTHFEELSQIQSIIDSSIQHHIEDTFILLIPTKKLYFQFYPFLNSYQTLHLSYFILEDYIPSSFISSLPSHLLSFTLLFYSLLHLSHSSPFTTFIHLPISSTFDKYLSLQSVLSSYLQSYTLFSIQINDIPKLDYSPYLSIFLPIEQKYIQFKINTQEDIFYSNLHIYTSSYLSLFFESNKFTPSNFISLFPSFLPKIKNILEPQFFILFHLFLILHKKIHIYSISSQLDDLPTERSSFSLQDWSKIIDIISPLNHYFISPNSHIKM